MELIIIGVISFLVGFRLSTLRHNFKTEAELKELEDILERLEEHGNNLLDKLNKYTEKEFE